MLFFGMTLWASFALSSVATNVEAQEPLEEGPYADDLTGASIQPSDQKAARSAAAISGLDWQKAHASGQPSVHRIFVNANDAPGSFNHFFTASDGRRCNVAVKYPHAGSNLYTYQVVCADMLITELELASSPFEILSALSRDKQDSNVVSKQSVLGSDPVLKEPTTRVTKTITRVHYVDDVVNKSFGGPSATTAGPDLSMQPRSASEHTGTASEDGIPPHIPPPEAAIVPLEINADRFNDFVRFADAAIALREQGGAIGVFDDVQSRDPASERESQNIDILSHLLHSQRRDIDLKDCVKLAVAWTRHSANRTRSLTESGKPPNNTGYDWQWIAQHPSIVPPACLKSHRSRECRVQRCMLRYHAALDIVTVFPALMYQSVNNSQPSSALGWFTHRTRLTTAHWGTTKTMGTYWPLSLSTTVEHDAVRTIAVDPVQTPLPSPKPKRFTLLRAERHGEIPLCWNQQTCCRECMKHPFMPRFLQTNSPLTWVITIAFLLGFSLALVGCTMMLASYLGRRRRHEIREKRVGYRGIVLERLARIPVVRWVVRGKSEDVPIATTATTATTPSTRRDSGSSRIPATTDPDIAELLNATANRGTLRRQAEEGRSRISFTPDSTRGPEKPAVVVTAAQGPSAVVLSDGRVPTPQSQPSGHDTVPQVRPGFETTHSTTASETPELHSVDGAHDRPSTGSRPVGYGSIRGRKKNRETDDQ